MLSSFDFLYQMKHAPMEKLKLILQCKEHYHQVLWTYTTIVTTLIDKEIDAQISKQPFLCT